MKINDFSAAKRIQLFLAVASLQLLSLPVVAQKGGPSTPNVVVPRTEDLPRFDLDFKGGSPQQLIASIESADVPINVIIPTGASAGVTIPPLKMRRVTVPQLFQALEVASQSSASSAPQRPEGGPGQMMMDSKMLERYFGVKINTNGPGGHTMPGFNGGPGRGVHYGFRTEGPPSNDSIWYFFQESPGGPHEQRICRYFQLESYLSKYTIDDITTAVETGWKMLGVKNTVQLNFHKETKLLIAVGEPQSMNMIEEVLAQLDKGLNQTNRLESPSAPVSPLGGGDRSPIKTDLKP
jgi:hypothetical protein